MFDGTARVLVGGNSSIEQTPSPWLREQSAKRPSSRCLALAVLS
jgi:hypothetical protein